MSGFHYPGVPVTALLYSLWPLFALIVGGYALRRWDFPGEAFWPAAERLNYFILFPALLFSNLATAPLDDPGLRAAVAALEIPLVETWSASAQPPDGAVVVGNEEAGRRAARHFAAKRYARVACVSADCPWERARRAGFIGSAAALGLELVADIVQPEVQHLNDGRMAFLRLLATNTIFDAVFCSSDLLAAAAVSEAHNRDLHVPQDLAVLGFSDDGSAAQWAQGLTTLAVDAADLGRRAARFLLDRLQGERAAGERETIEAVFEERLST